VDPGPRRRSGKRAASGSGWRGGWRHDGRKEGKGTVMQVGRLSRLRLTMALVVSSAPSIPSGGDPRLSSKALYAVLGGGGQITEREYQCGVEDGPGKQP